MKIFFLTSRFPYPLEKGDKLRAYYQLKYLSQNNDIILCALSHKKVSQSRIEELKKYCSEIYVYRISFGEAVLGILWSAFKGFPFQTGYFYSPFIKNKILKLINVVKPAHIYSQLIRTSEYVRTIKGNKTLDYMDAFSKSMERQAKSKNFFLSLLLRLESKRVKKYESAIFNNFKEKVIISEQDKKLILHPDQQKIHIVPNGVDVDFFAPDLSTNKDIDILFTGNMNYPPNIESAIFLANKILPLLHQADSNIKLMIAGANPSVKVKKLANKNIIVTGWVKDIRTCYNRAKVFVAPMFLSTGQQNKILEAMAMHLPCITTTLANNAIMATENTEILIANSEYEFSNKIQRLLNSLSLREAIGKGGCQFIHQNYTWPQTTALLNHIIQN